ncbi:ROK family protein [Pedobacter zeae]|uniref:Glucokinase n=1 Tax=Pedobacter zeae TaxID=1737356 RepID=A0A7W6KBF1_9SPHI|nr:ROK family protein [Pedobacter zeae]MBB4107600.1 glucokinase [Pedobacter zeae]GGG98283.1 hypothetical protein GCM10007422_10500 [Pedobacter zeae]
MLKEHKGSLLGVDIGGSHITASLIDMTEARVVSKSYSREKVKDNGVPEEILDVWINCIKRSIELGGINGSNVKMGIAMPGPFDYERGISLITGMNKLESLYKTDIRTYLSTKLAIPKENIIFRNDAEAFLHGEAHCGAVKRVSTALGITLGTGVGSAIHTAGTTLDANLGISPFKEGIVEDYLSTRWFVSRYRELTGKEIADAKPVFDLAASRDPLALGIVGDFITNLSEFLYNFSIRERPGAIVVGGNIAKAYPLYLDQVNANLVKLGIDVPVVPSALGEDAAMFGMAYYLNGNRPEENATLPSREITSLNIH